MKASQSLRQLTQVVNRTVPSSARKNSRISISPSLSQHRFAPNTATMTSGTFKYIDKTSYDPLATAPFEKPWAKVDGPGYSFLLADHDAPVSNIRDSSSPSTTFTTDTSGFSVHHAPAAEKAFTDDKAVRTGYYSEVENLLKSQLRGIKKVVIFDHTIRKHDPTSPRQPVQQVHVDQTPSAAAARVRRHLPAAEAEALLRGRYQIINVWRPIAHAATDFPLAVIDWRSTSPDDFVPIDLLYPDRPEKEKEAAASTSESSEGSSNASSTSDGGDSDDDDRGRERLPSPTAHSSTEGYSVKGETFGVASSPAHKFYYVKDMKPEEAMFIKCFDSRSAWMNLEKWAGSGGEGKAVEGVAHGTPHTAFIDPKTPEGVKGRESIEVRCLVFYE